MHIILTVAVCLCVVMLAVSAGSEDDPGCVDLKPRFIRWGLDVKSQGRRGTCSVFAVTAALEFAKAKRQGRGVRLSEEYLNWASNRAIGDDHDGGFFHDLWAGYVRFGVCSGDMMPYADSFDPGLQPSAAVLRAARSRSMSGLRWNWIKEWDVKNGLTAAQFDRVRAVLRDGWPVCAGLRWPKQADWTDGVLGMCPPEDVFDGHSILLVGYRDDPRQPGGGVFLIKNSGDGGTWCALPYAFVRTYTNDAGWVDYEPVKTESIGPSSTK